MLTGVPQGSVCEHNAKGGRQADEGMEDAGDTGFGTLICHGDTVTWASQVCAPWSSLQTDVLRAGEGTAADSTKISSISAS